MQFLRDKTLKQLGIYTLIFISGILIVQYGVIRHTIFSFTEAEQKIDFARYTQLTNQQITLQTQQVLRHQSTDKASLLAQLKQQDDRLKILAEGGRLEGKDQFIEPLSRLPKISFNHLQERYAAYKEAILVLLNEPTTLEKTIVIAEADSVNSEVTETIDIPNPAYTQANMEFEALWQNVSNSFSKLLADLEAEVLKKRDRVLNLFFASVVFDVLLLIALFYLFTVHVLKPLRIIKANTENHTHSNGFVHNEIGEVAYHINQTIENLKDATDFVTAIGEGKLDLDYKTTLDDSYEPGKNKLADSLIDMQGKLRQMNDEESKRKWANEGLAKFVDILRASNDNVKSLGDKVIASLVNYTESNQGALYILNDEDPHNKHLELISLFAFDIKKAEQQKIKLGQGILGQTFLEKETTYLTDFPEEYIRITSGLGDANPKSILMVPLKVDLQVYGIVELASFGTYEPHVISFVEKLGESIASTLASVRSTEKNRQLIEQFQQQTEEMRAQEEEMRQNMEELQATQEEISRKERSYLQRIEELESKMAAATSPAEIEALKRQWFTKEVAYQQSVAELQQQLAQKPARSDDWQLAEEVEKTLQLQLEALQITQEELTRKSRATSR